MSTLRKYKKMVSSTKPKTYISWAFAIIVIMVLVKFGKGLLDYLDKIFGNTLRDNNEDKLDDLGTNTNLESVETNVSNIKETLSTSRLGLRPNRMSDISHMSYAETLHEMLDGSIADLLGVFKILALCSDSDFYSIQKAYGQREIKTGYIFKDTHLGTLSSHLKRRASDTSFMFLSIPAKQFVIAVVGKTNNYYYSDKNGKATDYNTVNSGTSILNFMLKSKDIK